MIGIFSLAVFLTAFHRITKPYAIIFACSFSGATSVVLGIDCFSRAGLKEFWLYIWGLSTGVIHIVIFFANVTQALNDSIFPLKTYTYPHTRGMRVEIAVVLLITAFGVMSQMKLWKILKERRDQKRAERQKEQNDVERLDEDVGRRVEEEDRRERAEWEKIYGNTDSADKNTQPDSGVASRIGSGVTLMEDDGIRQVPGSVGKEAIGKEQIGKEGDTHIQVASVPVGRENIEMEVDNPVTESVQTIKMVSEEGSPQIEGAVNGSELAPIAEEDSLPPPPPPILVRHFTPYIPDEDDREEDAMSVATYADTINHTVHLQDLEKSIEVDIKAVDVDTLEKTPDNDITSKGEPENTTESGLKQHDSVTTVEQSQSPSRGNSSLEETGTTIIEPQPQPQGEVTNTKTEEVGGASTQCQPIEEPKVASTTSGERKISSVISGEKTTSSPASLADLDTLQNHCSRIHKTYRTNEWAKHLADADAVELDDLTPYFEEGIPEEVPVPVLVNQLQESAGSPTIERKPKLPKSPVSQELLSKDPTPISFAVTAAIPHIAPVPAPLPTPTSTPTPTITSSTSPPPPIAVAVPLKPILKPSSTPTIPEGEGAVVDKPHRTSLPAPSRAMSPTPTIPYENTLIGRRESFLKMRPSMLMNQEQIIRAASPIGYQNSTTVIDTTPVHGMGTGRMTPVNMEDMTLSQRREYLRNHIQQSGTPVQSRSGTPMPPLSPRNSFGPPSPTMGAAAKQNHLLQTWRESLRQDAQISHQNPTTWGERKALEALNEKQQAAKLKKEKETERIQRDAIVNERMRSPDMLSAHREAMRRLQAGASTH